MLISYCLFSAGLASSQRSDNAPPGTIQVNDSLYADITEVANVHWREYLLYLSNFDTANYSKQLPDTLVWETDSTENDYKQYYLRHPSFNDYPVVGISYDQALSFCRWRTFAANFYIYITENKFRNWRKHLQDSIPIRFYYRLPTAAEWELIASGNLSLKERPYGYDSTFIKRKGKYMPAFNCKYDGALPGNANSGDIFFTSPVRSFAPNSFNLYNLVGNVAEMVCEKGKAKGGSFIDQLEKCHVSDEQHYKKPERWLGFRCVAVRLAQ